MDILRITKFVNAFNYYAKNSLVRLGSVLPDKLNKLIGLINIGGMKYDNLGIEKPDEKWSEAIRFLQHLKDSYKPETFEMLFEVLSEHIKSDKFESFSSEWDKWMAKDRGLDFIPTVDSFIPRRIASLQNLLKVADVGARVQIARLIDSHVQHIIGLIENGNVADAKEYIDTIRPTDWELGQERNIDKIFELVLKELAKKLTPEAYQALGL